MKRTAALGIVTIYLLFASPAFAQEHQERDYETAMTKGTFAVETGDYAAAATYFERALAIRPGDKNATLSLGIAFSRSGDLAGASDALRAALAIDPSDLRAQYELGVVLYKRGELAPARELFTAVAEQAEGEVKTAAKGYLDRIAVREGSKRFALDIQGGVQYDSNVLLEPEAAAVPPKERKGDGRAVVTLDGRYAVVDRERYGADVRYQFYQSAHLHLEDFNVDQQTASLGVRAGIGSSAQFRLRYSFGYTTVGGDHYETSNHLRPSLEMKFSPQSMTELYTGFEKRRFLSIVVFPSNADRTGTDAIAGITHTVLVTTRTGVSLGYAYDRDSARVNIWDSIGNKGSLQVQSDLGAVSAFAGLSFTDRQYNEANPALSPKRHDQTQEYSAGLSREISKTVRLTVSDFYTYNVSNLAGFEYKRNIIGLFAEVRL